MRLWQTPPQSLFNLPTFSLSPANFIDWEAQNEVFERMAIYRVGRQILTGSGEPDAVVAVRASADFLPIVGLSPTLGRGFTREDDDSGRPLTALLSESFFRTRFGGEPSSIGKTILLNRVPHTIIGVVPNAPVFIERAQVYVPLAWDAKERAVRNNHNYRGIAKLKAGASVERAQADLTAISKRLEQQYPDDNKDWGALVRPLQDDLIADVRRSLLVLLGAVALVLLIACARPRQGNRAAQRPRREPAARHPAVACRGPGARRWRRSGRTRGRLLQRRRVENDVRDGTAPRGRSRAR
jgi:hypothetical protein